MRRQKVVHMSLRRHLLLLIVLINSSLLFAQSSYVSVNKEDNLIYEADLLQHVDSFHSCIYPRIQSQLINYEIAQQLLLKNSNSKFINFLSNKPLISLFNESTSISPIINLEGGKSFSDAPSPNIYGTGLRLKSDITKKLAIHMAVFGAKQTYNVWDQRQIDSTMVLPHQGEYNAKIGDAYVYTDWRGYISYQPSNYINFQLGKDLNFWGDGHRSLLLSDNSVSYPFLKATVTAGKLQYIVLYQFLKDIDTEFETYPNENKYSTSHFLSWNILKRFNIYLFETVVWRDKIPEGGKRGYDFNYMNPIIFFRPVEHSLGSPDNYLMGGGLRARIFNNTHFYAQLILDEFKLKEIRSDAGWWANKYGYQLGMKIYNLFGIQNMFVRGEYNMVRPFTYSHGSSMENYGHMYQPLAHPLGANFKEFIALANYRNNRWQMQAKLIYAQIGFDSDSLNQGQNMYRSYDDNRKEYGNTLLQGDLTDYIHAELKASYIVNPAWNLRFEMGFRSWMYKSTKESIKQNQVFIGLRTLF